MGKSLVRHHEIPCAMEVQNHEHLAQRRRTKPAREGGAALVRLREREEAVARRRKVQGACAVSWHSVMGKAEMMSNAALTGAEGVRVE